MIRTALAAGLALVLVAGCGGDGRLATEEIEPTIAEALLQRWGVGPIVVECPEQIAARAGASFDCDVTVARQELSVRVDERDDDGTLDLLPSAAVLSTPALEDDIARTLADELERDAEIECEAGAVVVVVPGGTVTCRASDGADRRTVTVTVTDVDGTRRYELSEPSS